MEKKDPKDFAEKTIITKVTKLDEISQKQAYILFLSGPLIGKLFQLKEGLTVIGRAPDADIEINDARISRHHVRIEVDEGKVFASDMGSTNGTFVNGARISKRELADGDKLQISSQIVFKFAFQDRTENIFHKELYKMAIVDPVTNIYNKRFFLERLNEEFSHARRTKVPISLLMIDIDFFKKVNDTHGHLAGDMILQKLADIIKQKIRNEDIIARYGGEEFIALLRNTGKDGAFILAERIRKFIEEENFEFEGHKIKITISIGVAPLEEDHDFNSYEDFIKAADEKLYYSKEHGRNQTTV